MTKYVRHSTVPTPDSGSGAKTAVLVRVEDGRLDKPASGGIRHVTVWSAKVGELTRDIRRQPYNKSGVAPSGTSTNQYVVRVTQLPIGAHCVVLLLRVANVSVMWIADMWDSDSYGLTIGEGIAAPSERLWLSGWTCTYAAARDIPQRASRWIGSLHA